MKKKHVLITGGAGFIGSHLTDKLLKRGFEVTILDSLLPQVHEDEEKDLDGWPTYVNPAARKIKGTIESHFNKVLEGVTHLVHLAASVGVGQSMTNIYEYTKNNTLSAAIILEALEKKRHSIERMVVASSMSIYGEGAYRSSKGICAPPLRDYEQLKEKQWELLSEGELLQPIPTSEEKPLHPASIYAINKRDHEEMFLVVGQALKIPTIGLRLFNTYGSRQALSNPYTGVIAIFISRLLNNLPPRIFEDGEQKRDFVHVSDVTNACALVLESDEKLWDVFNVGSGHALTCKEVATILAQKLGKTITPEILYKYRVGDVRHCFANIEKMKRVFGYSPEIAFHEGIEECIAWTKNQDTGNKTNKSMEELSEMGLII